MKAPGVRPARRPAACASGRRGRPPHRAPGRAPAACRRTCRPRRASQSYWRAVCAGARSGRAIPGGPSSRRGTRAPTRRREGAGNAPTASGRRADSCRSLPTCRVPRAERRASRSPPRRPWRRAADDSGTPCRTASRRRRGEGRQQASVSCRSSPRMPAATRACVLEFSRRHGTGRARPGKESRHGYPGHHRHDHRRLHRRRDRSVRCTPARSAWASG